MTFWRCAGKGVHRFTFDGRYAYISPEMDGYVGNIVMILDLADPTQPQEVGRWWMPGQWTAGGETPTWKGRQHRCHHPIRAGDRLYVSYWHGGFVILDISDMSKPKFVSGLDWSPPFSLADAHRACRSRSRIRGRRDAVVADEDVRQARPVAPPSFLWMVDITDETRPVPVASFQVEGVDGKPQPEYDRLPSADRDDHAGRRFRSRGSPRAAHRRHRQSARAARGRALRARRRRRARRASRSNDVFVDERGLDLRDRPRPRAHDSSSARRGRGYGLRWSTSVTEKPMNSSTVKSSDLEWPTPGGS